MSTYREAVEQLEAIAAEKDRPAETVSLSLRERVGVRVSPKHERLHALPPPTQPAQETP